MSVLVRFREKHGDRYVGGASLEDVMTAVLLDRVNDGYWYDEEATISALISRGSGKAAAFMQARQGFEYEDYEIVRVEKV